MLVFLLVSFSFTLFSQTHQIGFSVGNGKSTIDDAINTPFFIGIDNSNFSQKSYFLTTGFSYMYYPKKAFFNLNTGVNYSYRELSENNLYLNYIRIPLGIDFILGKKIKFVLGTGFYLGALLNKNDIKAENSNLFQLGFSLKGGILLTITEKISLGSFYNKNEDITPIYTKEVFGISGNKEESIKIRGKDGFFSLGIFYYFSN